MPPRTFAPQTHLGTNMLQQDTTEEEIRTLGVRLDDIGMWIHNAPGNLQMKFNEPTFSAYLQKQLRLMPPPYCKSNYDGSSVPRYNRLR